MFTQSHVIRDIIAEVLHFKTHPDTIWHPTEDSHLHGQGGKDGSGSVAVGTGDLLA